MTSPTELLLTILRPGLGPVDTALDSFQNSDWNALLAITSPDLHPYVAFRLQALIKPERIPASARATLLAARRSGVVAHLQRQTLLRQMASALDEDKVPFVVLKGMALGHLAYPAPALRPMGDIDLWTRPEHLDAAARALRNAGLRYPERLSARNPTALRPETASTRMFELPGSRLIVELHGRLKSIAVACPNWEEGAWMRCVRADLGGVEALVPEAGDMLTHLAVHCGAHHRFEFGLRALLDISLWLEYATDRLPWPDLQERWTRDGADTWIYLALSISRELLGAPVPAAYFRDSVPPTHFDELRALGLAQVLNATRRMPPALTRLSTLPSVAARARYLASRLTTWYWAGRNDGSRTTLEAVRQAGRRMAHDLRYKIPPYLSGLMSGNLRGEEFRKRRELAAGRERMTELVALERQGRRRGQPT